MTGGDTNILKRQRFLYQIFGSWIGSCEIIRSIQYEFKVFSYFLPMIQEAKYSLVRVPVRIYVRFLLLLWQLAYIWVGALMAYFRWHHRFLYGVYQTVASVWRLFKCQSNSLNINQWSKVVKEVSILDSSLAVLVNLLSIGLEGLLQILFSIEV